MYARKRSKVLAMTHWWSQRVTSPIFGKTTNGDCRTFELQRQLTSRAKTFRKRDNALIDRRDQIAREIRSLSLCVILIERIQARREPWTRTPNGHLTNLRKHIQKGKCYKKTTDKTQFKMPNESQNDKSQTQASTKGTPAAASAVGIFGRTQPPPPTQTKMKTYFIVILYTYHRIFRLVRRVSPCKRYPLCLPWPMELTVSRCHWIKKQKRDRWNLPRLVSNTRRMTEKAIWR